MYSSWLAWPSVKKISGPSTSFRNSIVGGWPMISQNVRLCHWGGVAGYLLGPAVEGWARPADVARYRRTAYAMGLWGSLAVPAIFPLVQLSMLIAHSRAG